MPRSKRKVFCFFSTVIALSISAWALFHCFDSQARRPELVIERSNQTFQLIDPSGLPDPIEATFSSHANTYQDEDGAARSARAVPMVKIINAMGGSSKDSWFEIDSADGFKSYVDYDYLTRFKPILYFEISGHPIDGLTAHYGPSPMGPFIFYPSDLSSRKILEDNPEEVFYQWNVVKIRVLKKAEAETYTKFFKASRASYFASSFCIHCHSAGDLGGSVSKLGFSELSNIARSDPKRFIDSIGRQDLAMDRPRMEARNYWTESLKSEVRNYFSDWKQE